MKNRLYLIIFLVIYIALFAFFVTKDQESSRDASVMTDVSRLMPVKIKKLIHFNEESLTEVIQEAQEKNLPISIAGTRHSMGGHTYYHDAIVLDMTTYNKILSFDPKQQTITVQSGATWNDIQTHINPYGLAIKIMQSQNIFTVGGSISANAHGRDIRFGSLIDTVKAFKLLTANGMIIEVSREENEELFSLVIGGYGLFGVILEVELDLTEDEVYRMDTKALNYSEYTDYFKEQVLLNPDVHMHLARISTASNYFLEDMYVTNYYLTDKTGLEEINELKKEQYTAVTKFSLGLARNYEWGRNWFWDTQKTYFEKQDGTYMTRNNVMRSESKFLEYENDKNTDVLQEYFIPINHFTEYIDDLRKLLEKEELNLVNITIRYVSKNDEAVLSYAKEDSFALVLLINQGFSQEQQKETERVIRKMVDITLSYGGSYYLPYMLYPTKEQMLEAYPRTNEFFKQKHRYDPNDQFVNFFYERYK
ncbi:FAD-binding oxidoreductase [Bacillus solitudinis]|uniref:FAD-binding oxidoreductase n=1 Tax=Bacillus solitudinis TaxID=2014074 RepID=UPI000C23536D|nr:FAD-binding oxidoreductase [Bacillus solitudinis]